LILVVSTVANDAADELVGMFPPGAASLVTASNLSESFRAAVLVGDFPQSEISVGGGAPIRARDVEGVITTVSRFLPQEFYYIEPADRDYVCAEVGAFFTYFLSELGCRKLNPPTAKSLSGLGRHRIEWLKDAKGCGVPVWPLHLRNGVPAAEESPRGLRYLRSTIVGGSIVEERTPDAVGGHMRALSRAFSVPYLSGLFVSPDEDGYFLADLASVPDISTRENREAMVRYLA
jgi:hypothetical protein